MAGRGDGKNVASRCAMLGFKRYESIFILVAHYIQYTVCVMGTVVGVWLEIVEDESKKKRVSLYGCTGSVEEKHFTGNDIY